MTEQLFRDDAYLRECAATVIAADERGITLDRTVFYPTGGGQPGDTGTIRLADGGEIAIVDTVKAPTPDGILHIPAPGSTLPAAGSAVVAAIDWERRHRHMRMHTCMHLVCAIVPGAVTGGQVGADRSRLDFDIPGEALDKAVLTEKLNALVAADHPVASTWITDAEMAERPELVRTMSVKPPSGQGRVRLLDIAGVDLQPCGGTHVQRTGEIGRVEIAKIENKGRQNRRVVIAFA
ncbi:misacylated tRNA(Ala) deacylase [Stella humosa]|uniref:Alanine--tRNA ligase n=1 Tax=Stella humosa TaxID=94 RepID=A0A3N1M8C7_9PROT|nr:alanyl-tRNA editing protein [Stella humosa]ROP99930.1 misacylated tRNA(Ala) deacylase [Stella humosa]BBK30840.1 Ala-tRNA(Pro) hydrolase [Stella humosa]